MKHKYIIFILLLIILTSCTSTNQNNYREDLKIELPKRISEEGYYNGPLTYSVKQRDNDRRKEYWDSKTDSFYSNK